LRKRKDLHRNNENPIQRKNGFYNGKEAPGTLGVKCGSHIEMKLNE